MIKLVPDVLVGNRPESSNISVVHNSQLVTGIVCAIRNQIARGAWARGSQLPTRNKLASLFATSPSTVQSAIRVLTADGSVVTRKRAGTCIATSAPEYGRFALVMSDHGPSPVLGSTFFHDKVLVTAARVPKLHRGWHLEAFTAHDERLLSLVRSGALEGIIYIGTPEMIPPVAETGIPLACFHYDGAPWYGDVNLTTDKTEFIKTCIQTLMRHGFRKIGIIDPDLQSLTWPDDRNRTPSLEDYIRMIEDHGGQCPPAWIQCVDARRPLTTYQTLLMLLRNPSDRPNSLILMDDHLLPAALKAIRDLGLVIPSQVAVCVLGYDGRDALTDGCMRVGFDIERMVIDSLQQLSLIRQGKQGLKELPCAYLDLGLTLQVT